MELKYTKGEWRLSEVAIDRHKTIIVNGKAVRIADIRAAIAKAEGGR